MLSMAHPAIPIISGSLLAFALSTAHAADLPIPTTVEVVTPALQSPWSFAIAPYFWAAGLQGDIAEFGVPSVHVDASFSDIFKNLDFGAMAVSELRYNRFGLFTDLMYVKISGEAGTPDGVLATDASAGSKTMTSPRSASTGCWTARKATSTRWPARGSGGSTPNSASPAARSTAYRRARTAPGSIPWWA